MTEDEIILTHILQCRSMDLALNKPVLSEAQQKQFEEYKRRRSAGEPLQYILGTCNFMGLELAVDPSVLVPRPETEQLVDQAVQYLTKAFPKGKEVIQILDLGTGSGNIAIALAKLIPNAKVVTIDVSAQALDVAHTNAKRHGVDKNIEFINDDFLASFKAIPNNPWAKESKKGLFDFIISNPPYIPTAQMALLPEDVKQEPALALEGGEDGLKFYQVIIKYSPYLLRDGACLMMEFGDGQAEAIKNLYQAQGSFSNIQIFKDLAGRERIINGKIHH